ncbi:hypothetical protein P43SY_000580 [Pythium insidiosum]|uniref:Uncharacterized protein n=1 Tax=Pythium insidiosum TaxID=114742 RepID=A0AAD5Q6U6_PYTIN|nr:hypothetical protein P43SY_000580 [Pythium insidiosum]
MDLIEAMEEMEKNGAMQAQEAPCDRSSDQDFFLQQIAHLHDRLKAQWAMQYRLRTPIAIPFPWIVARALRLLEEYPDGLTEAVLVTELMAHLHHRERRHVKRQRSPTVQELLEDDADAVLYARVLAYADHTVRLSVSASLGDVDTSPPAEETGAVVRMHLHQRFRSCLAALHAMGIGTQAAGFPFAPTRTLVLTNAKLLEPSGRGRGRRPRATGAGSHTLLPTPYVAVVLDDHERELRDRAWRFAQVDALAADASRHEHELQQLVVTAQVVDIGAVRPCATPYHLQRQLILLGDVGGGAASHMLLLWDEQVALSRLFHVGDVLTLLYPFVHVAEPTDGEVDAVMDEIASQQRCSYYLEYGSATTLFVTPRRQSRSADGDAAAPANGATRELQQGEDRSCMAVGAALPGWIGFCVYGHVASIAVSHGVPLLAAFYHSYYDPKTNGAATAAGGKLSKGIVSKYFFLVVLVELYDSMSGDTLVVELTGNCAEKALTLREGQTVFLEGLVAVDLRRDRSLRARRQDSSASSSSSAAASQLFDSTTTSQQQPWASTAAAGFAFPDDCYLSPSSRVVALCSDWERIFGRQTDAFRESRVSVVNELPGVLKTEVRRQPPAALVATWRRERALLRKLPMVRGRFLVTSVGWMVPRSAGDSDAKLFEWDTSCAKGFSTMLAHRACRRRLEMAPPAGDDDADRDRASAPPRWRCGFCAEIFAGMDATTQTFCPLLVQLDDASRPGARPLVALCHGDAVATILHAAPEEFAQLSLPRKSAVLRHAIGRELDVVLSRCLAHRVLLSAAEGPRCVALRIDQAQPVNVVGSARRLMASSVTWRQRLVA